MSEESEYPSLSDGRVVTDQMAEWYGASASGSVDLRFGFRVGSNQ